MADNFTCDKCGEEFDSKRGLHIHEGQVHDDEVNDTEEKDEQEDNESVEAGKEEVSTTTSGSEDTFPVDKRSFQISTELALFSVFVLGIAVGLSSGLLVAGSGGSFDLGQVGMPSGDSEESGSDGPTVDVSNIDTSGEPVLGQSDAPVTMVVYEDFQCPFCQRFEQGAVSQIESNYVVEGDVKIIWKDFPLATPFTSRNIHPWATPAAETMECVYRQDNDAFWSVKDTVFSNQNSLNTDNVESEIIQWAVDQGVSESEVRSCLENGNPLEEVRSDVQEGKNFEAVIDTPSGPSPFVSSTPSAVIYSEGDSTGEPVVGAQPYGAFRNIIESKLGN